MDIRSFFSPKKPKTKIKTKTNNDTSNNDNPKPSESTYRKTPKSRATVKPSSTNIPPSKSVSQTKSKNKTKSNTATTVRESSSSSTTTKSKRVRSRIIIDDSEDNDSDTVAPDDEKTSMEVEVSDDNDDTAPKSNTNKSKAKSNDGNKKARVEMSAEAFFSSPSSKPKSTRAATRKKAPSNKKIIEDDSDETDDFVLDSEKEDSEDEHILKTDLDLDDTYQSKPKSTKRKPQKSDTSPAKASVKRTRTSARTATNDFDDPMDVNSNDEITSPRKRPRAASSSSSPTPKKPSPKRKSTTQSKGVSPKKAKQQTKKILIKPTAPYPKPFTTDDVPSGCLTDVTFVVTGVLPNLSRTDFEDFVKILGGRVTTAVSGKTNYLVCGSELEDGREVTEGSKYKKAKGLGEEVVIILHGEEQFYGVVQCICEMKGGSVGKTEKIYNDSNHNANGNQIEKKAVTSNDGKEIKSVPIANPYVKRSLVNPYAKKQKVNPYAKAKTSYVASSSSNNNEQIGKTGRNMDANDKYALWADKYAPSSTRQILGNAESVRKLKSWLDRWESTYVTPRKKGGRGFSGPPQKAALLSGPPGIGKTTTAVLVAKESGREVLEWNASDVRSKKGMEAGLGDVMGSQVLHFGGENRNRSNEGIKKRCIIMDEVDGMGAGDRSGMAELIKSIKSSKVPIICICNDRQSQKVRSLVPYCLDLRYRRPVKSVIARRAVEVGRMENMNIEINAAEAIAESCGNDIRQVLNCIQMWSNKNGNGQSSSMTYKELKDRQNDINKDEMLRVSMFDSTRMIVEGPRGLGRDDVPQSVANKSFFDRCDAYFTEYNLMGLNVHQNYLKVMISQIQETKRSDESDKEVEVLERMERATQSMSDFAVSEHKVMSGDQLWQLLPLCSVLTVKAGYHASGKNGSFLPGYPEFAGWLGKNSTRGKKRRILQELSYHMNYSISADKTALRMNYLPVLRERLLTLMKNKEGSKVNETIELMDKYGLDRDDLFENIDEFILDPKAFKFASLDSKAKASFTREYNKREHKSQALIQEQNSSKSSRKKQSQSDGNGETKDLDAINDDKFEESNSENDEDDVEAIKKLFKKKGNPKSTKSKAKTKRNRKKK